MKRENASPQNTTKYDAYSKEELLETCQRMDAELSSMRSQMDYILEQIKLSNKKRFGSSSEKNAYGDDYEQLSFSFNELEAFQEYSQKTEPDIEEAVPQRKRAPRPKGKRERDLSGLPVIIREYELPEEERICPECGWELHDMKMEVRSELVLIPSHFEVVEHRRHLYTCRSCEKNALETGDVPFIKTPAPKPLIPGSIASPELVAGIINGKYINALPLARQEKEYQRNGVELSRQTMGNWLLYCTSHYLVRIYEEMRRQLLELDVIHADETTCTVVNEPGRKGKTKSYMWMYCSGWCDKPVVVYEYQETRKAEHLKTFLKISGGYQGYLHSDGYEAYHSLWDEITVVGCLSHIRRKFMDALDAVPEKDRKKTKAYEGVKYCDILFEIDRKLKECDAVEKQKLRLELEKPVTDAFYVWLKKAKENTSHQSLLGKAVTYGWNQWEYFINYQQDGRLELSNNRAERYIKNFVIGRKNFTIIATPRGARMSAQLYSIVVTAKENGLKPYNYLCYVLKEMSQHKEMDLDLLMPWSGGLPEDCYVPKKSQDQ